MKISKNRFPVVWFYILSLFIIYTAFLPTTKLFSLILCILVALTQIFQKKKAYKTFTTTGYIFYFIYLAIYMLLGSISDANIGGGESTRYFDIVLTLGLFILTSFIYELRLAIIDYKKDKTLIILLGIAIVEVIIYLYMIYGSGLILYFSGEYRNPIYLFSTAIVSYFYLFISAYAEKL